MTDLAQTGVWTAVLAAGLGTCVALHRLGVPRTWVRDLLHIGAGVWVLGWPRWHAPLAPLCIVAAALVLVSVVPVLSRRVALVGRLREAVSDDEETWAGIIFYVFSFAALSAVGLLWRMLPAGGALLALALGDGLGGAIGRRFGRHHFDAPGAKQKSVEGSVAVAVGGALGIALAAAWLGPPLPLWRIGLGGVVAAYIEASSPRSSDNVLVPVAVLLVLAL